MNENLLAVDLAPLCHHWDVRTTLCLDDDVLQEVRKYARNRNITIGKAVSELVRRGLSAPLRTRLVNGFHVVDLPPGSPTLRPEDIKRLEQEYVDHLARKLARPRGTDT